MLDTVLDGNDNQTFYSLGRLRDIIVEGSKPLVFWVGAGASRWRGYPSWDGLAKLLHSRFSKAEPRYDRATGSQLIDNDLPAVFSLCRNASSTLYYRLLAESFLPRLDTPIYKSFLDALASNDPLYVLTTNVEEALEQHLASATIVQRSDFERCISLMQSKRSFVCKLHGSVSMIKSTVFTTEDYWELERDEAYLSLLKHVFAESTVVFIGYGLKDEYVLRTLGAIEAQTTIFGNGPHFLAAGSAPAELPNSIMPLRYLVDARNDHRSAISVLNVIRECRMERSFAVPRNDEQTEPAELKSGYFISDFLPPGTWTTSQTLTVNGDGPSPLLVLVGQGFVQQELPTAITASPRDLLVGLLCFDRVYMPLNALALLRNFVGGELFSELVSTDALQFIHIPQEPSCIFEPTSLVGDIGVIAAGTESQKIRSPEEVIRRQMKAGGEREAETDQLVRHLEGKIPTFNSETWNVSQIARGALLHVKLRRLIGMSEGVRPTAIPRWLAYPTLRVAHVVNTAMLCQQFSLAAAKLWFGGEVLAGAIFGVAAARDWAHEAASYVVAGRADIDISSLFSVHLLMTIMKFRDTREGIELRKEALEHLKVNAGSEFISSVNGGLKGNVSFGPLDKSRRVFSTLLTAEGPTPPGLTLGIWHNPYYSDAAMSLWRKRSRQYLDALCKERQIGVYDDCPCGSGEKLKFCCQEALG